MSDAAPQFELTGGDGRFRLAGAATYGNARRLLETGRRAFGTAPATAIDLTGLLALDSAGLAVLLAWLGQARATGRTLRFEALPAALAPMARVAGVEALISPSAG